MKFYLAYRENNSSWQILHHRPFIVNHHVGQFISSTWFQISMSKKSAFDFLVIQLNVDNINKTTHDFVISSLKHIERQNQQFESLLFVVYHKHCSCEYITSIIEKLEKHKNKSYYTIQDPPIPFGFTYSIMTHSKRSEYLISCPMFTMKN